MEREELLAQIAEREAANERDRAKLAALDTEPDWGPAVERYCGAAEVPHACRAAVKRGLQAALPLAPAPLPMGEDEIEELAREVVDAITDGERRPTLEHDNAVRSAEFAIRETLRRVPAWPGEFLADGEALLIAFAEGTNWTPEKRAAYSRFASVIRRLKARMGAGGGAECDSCNGLNTSCPEGCERDPKAGELLLGEQPWIDWHGGECPVPAETRVEVRFRMGKENRPLGCASRWLWGHDDDPYDIVAYRIIPGEEA
jgi:hypothetical protein